MSLMKLKTKNIKPCDLNMVSHRTCNYICICINEVANSIVVYNYNMTFIT